MTQAEVNAVAEKVVTETWAHAANVSLDHVHIKSIQTVESDSMHFKKLTDADVDARAKGKQPCQNLFAAFWRQPFRILDQRVEVFWKTGAVQHDGGGNNRPGQGAAAHFINSDDPTGNVRFKGKVRQIFRSTRFRQRMLARIRQGNLPRRSARVTW